MVTLGKIGHAVSETAILYAMLGTSMTGLLNPLAYAYWDKSYRGGYKKALERVLLLCTCSKLKTENMPGNTHCYNMPTSGTAFNKTLQFFYRPYIVSMKNFNFTTPYHTLLNETWLRWRHEVKAIRALFSRVVNCTKWSFFFYTERSSFFFLTK